MSIQKYLSALVCFTAFPLYSVSVSVSNATELNDAITNAANNTTIQFLADITLDLNLRPVNTNNDFGPNFNIVRINGNGHFLDGANAFQGFTVHGTSANLEINKLTTQNTKIQGGSGGVGQCCGGGGGGFGGGLFVDDNDTISLLNPVFSSCNATGGSGASNPGSSIGAGGGGGGGYRGDGGDSRATDTSGGGGGGFDGQGSSTAGSSNSGGAGGGGALGAGQSGSGTSGGMGGTDFGGANGGAGGTSGVPGAFGGPAGGGGGGGNTATGGQGGSAAGGGGGGDLGSGGSSLGFGGGGGSGSNVSNGGAGGFAGGGGGGSSIGGSGGFGGGGGGSLLSAGTSTFGGGSGGLGTSPGGGGGAGFGGAVFIRELGALIINGSPVFTGNSVTPGSGGTSTNPLFNGGIGSKAGADIFMMSGASLTLDLDSNLTFSAPIEGDIGVGGGSQTANGLTKLGPARLTLTGDNTYTGTTTVSEGELIFNSSIISELVIDPGATVKGNFTAKAAGTNPNAGTVRNSGTLSAGIDGLGQITIEGQFFNTATGTLIVDITPSGEASDKLFINETGTGQLDGTLEVIINQGNYIKGTVFTIVNGTTTGEFANVVKTGTAAGLFALRIEYGSALIIVEENFLFQQQNIKSGTPQEVVDVIIACPPAGPDTDFGDIVELLGTLSDSDVNKALTDLSPVRFGAVEWINARNNSYVADLLAQHRFELHCSPRDCYSCDCNASVWVNVFGNSMSTKKRINDLRRYNADAVGVLAGIDWCCDDIFYYGGSIGYTHTDLLWRNDGGKGNINSYYGALYGSWQCNCFTVDISVIGGGTQHDLKRELSFSIIDRTAKSDYWAWFITPHLGLRGQWGTCCAVLEPFAVVDYHYFHSDSFKESGANSISLNVKSKSQHFLRAEAGIDWRFLVDCCCYCISPYIGLSYVGEFPLNDGDQRASFRGRSCVMDVTSYHSDVHLVSPQAGIKYSHCNGFSFILGYKGLYNRNTIISQGEGRLEWVF